MDLTSDAMCRRPKYKGSDNESTKAMGWKKAESMLGKGGGRSWVWDKKTSWAFYCSGLEVMP